MTDRVAGETTGEVLGIVELPLVEIKLRELARALGDDDGAVAPTATVLAAHFCDIGASPNELVIRASGTDQSRTLLGEIGWDYARPLRSGETLRGEVRYLGSERRPRRHGGTLVVTRGATTWRGADGEVAVEVEVSLLCVEAAETGAAEASDG